MSGVAGVAGVFFSPAVSSAKKLSTASDSAASASSSASVALASVPASSEATRASASTWYFDGDSDNVGGEESEEACEAPEDYVAETGDCDDYNPLVNPGATGSGTDVWSVMG